VLRGRLSGENYFDGKHNDEEEAVKVVVVVGDTTTSWWAELRQQRNLLSFVVILLLASLCVLWICMEESLRFYTFLSSASSDNKQVVLVVGILAPAAGALTTSNQTSGIAKGRVPSPTPIISKQDDGDYAGQEELTPSSLVLIEGAIMTIEQEQVRLDQDLIDNAGLDTLPLPKLKDEDPWKLEIY